MEKVTRRPGETGRMRMESGPAVRAKFDNSGLWECFNGRPVAEVSRRQHVLRIRFSNGTQNVKFPNEHNRVRSTELFELHGEFDPGSGRTLAARLTHASRTELLLRGELSGERVRNT